MGKAVDDGSDEPEPEEEEEEGREAAAEAEARGGILMGGGCCGLEEMGAAMGT
jgi:hypothetical protein